MAFGRKLYSIPEIYSNIFKAIQSRGGATKAISKGIISKEFRERIMLAVTEVNKCDMCSYAHTKAALEAGMSNEEIKQLLQGNLENAPEDELKALMFAQHYAEERGRPTPDTWVALAKEYGREKAKGILGIVREIMVGNSLGIPLGSFKNRFKGNPDPRSGLGYELAVLISVIPMVIIAVINVLAVKSMDIVLED